MIRDFTYIDDIVESIYRVIRKPPLKNNSFNKANPNASISWAPYKIFNIGNSNPTPLMIFIKALEKYLGKEAKKTYLPLQSGDVPATFADTELLENWINFKPSTSVEEGISKFVEWYKDFYKINI